MDKKQRNSSIELLRVIFGLGIIVLHYNNYSIGGGFKYVANGSLNQYFLYFTESFFIITVNLFVLISAYFLCQTSQRRFIKVVDLLLQVILFRVCLSLGPVIIHGGSVTVKDVIKSLIPLNYYAILYCTLYIVSPYLNISLDRLSKTGLTRLVVTLMLLFSVWTTAADLLESVTRHTFNGLSTVGMYGSQYGYSIVNFILLYVIGAYIAKTDIINRFSRKQTAAAALILLVVLFACSITEHKLKFSRITTWNYNNPLPILLAAAVFVLFLKTKIKTSRIINELAGAVFTCFLIHRPFLQYAKIEEAVQKSLPLLALHQFLFSAGVFLVSYVVYKVYRWCTRWLIRRLTPLCDKVNLTAAVAAAEQRTAPAVEKAGGKAAPRSAAPAAAAIPQKTPADRVKDYYNRTVQKIQKNRFIFEELTKRDFKQKYKRTVLGMLWSILSPLLTLLVMRMVFTQFFGRNTLHYTTYIFTGNILYSYYREATSGGMNALMGNSNIFTKVNVPKYLFVISKNVSATFNFGLTLLIFFLFALLDKVPFHWNFLLLIYPICCITLFNIGFGMILSALYVFFRDIKYLYDVFSLLLMYLSAIFYYVDKYPPTMQQLFLLNPIYCYIKYFRIIVLDGAIPPWQHTLLSLFYALLFLGLGARIYKKYNHQFLYYM